MKALHRMLIPFMTQLSLSHLMGYGSGKLIYCLVTESSKCNMIFFFPSFIQGNQKYSDLFDFKCKLSGEKHYEENRKKSYEK